MSSSTISPRRPGESRIAGILLVAFFVVLGVVVLIPFASILLTSFKDSSTLIRNGFNLKISFDTFTLENYKYLFSGEHDFFRWFGNSIFLTFVQTVLTLFISAWVGYGFAFYNFKGKNFLFVCVLIVMMIPFEILMLPMYREIIAMKLMNNYIGIMLPFLANPIAIFFFRQFLQSIPKEIVDAGRMDGCSEYGIFLRLIMPIMKPAFAAMAIYVGMTSWNNFLWPMLVLTETKLFTLPIGLNSLLGPYGNNYLLLVSGAVMSVLPIMVLFFSAQRFFIEGMSTGSVKG
ncbi:MAG TPA: arabinose transporter permease [Anaerolineaceae bacterium]|nr:arabinose transporter permease [Anaerolineaceae bacterium]